MGGILGRNDTAFTWCTARRCFFRALFVLPPPAKPPAIVWITSRLPLLSASLGGLSFAGCRSPLLSWLFRPRWGDLVRLGGSARRGGSRPFLMKRRRCPAWISSSILSFRAWHSSIECQAFWWYQPCFFRSALFGLTTFFGGGSTRRSEPRPESSLYRSSGVCILRTGSVGLGCPGVGHFFDSTDSSLFFSPPASTRAWLQNSLSSSNCMYLASLFLSW